MPPCRFGLLQSNLSSKKWSTRIDLSEFLETARLILDCTPLHKIDLDKLSAEVGLSKHHFVRLFHKAYGQPPVAYATAKVLNRAAKMLLESNKSVSEIGYESGFMDSSSFSKAFSRAFSQSPSNFRTSGRVSRVRLEPS